MSFRSFTHHINYIFLACLFLLNTSCKQRQDRTHLEVQNAETFINSIDIKKRWDKIKPLAVLLQEDQKVSRLAIDNESIFALSDQKVLDAILTNKKLILKTNGAQWTKEELDSIVKLIDKCTAVEACGYDCRSLPNYLRIFIRPNVYFLILFETTEQRFYEKFKKDAEKRYNARGDLVRQINDTLFICTERR